MFGVNPENKCRREKRGLWRGNESNGSEGAREVKKQQQAPPPVSAHSPKQIRAATSVKRALRRGYCYFFDREKGFPIDF
jgi:hypothetical protein